MKYILLALCALSLSACGAFRSFYGFDPGDLDSANKQMAFAYMQIGGLTDLTESLLTADVISADQAEQVSIQLNKAFDTLEATRVAIAANGDPFTAQTEIEKATASINLALALLRQFAPRQTALYIERKTADEFRARYYQALEWGARPRLSFSRR